MPESLIETSRDIILELKEQGITHDFLTEFISKSVIYGGSALGINPELNDVVGESVVSIENIEAFAQALKPSRTKPPS